MGRLQGPHHDDALAGRLQHIPSSLSAISALRMGTGRSSRVSAPLRMCLVSGLFPAPPSERPVLYVIEV